ncbi:MAG TPA: hypothetical protein VKB50_26035 [Vicinamibacterales bacterium]|nr:hypothetical protein [Vicinamibacterales bacterium]
MGPRLSTRTNRAITALVAVAVFGFSWFFRFNNPDGSFAGLSDDHFFYLVRGWQILFGDVPVRDFVDHGAPFYYYVAAAVQVVFGRGTLSELAFSVTLVSLGAALTFWLAARASGSVLLGLVGAAFQILLAPRLYNYPKILAYAAAIPLLWWFADRPGTRPLFWIALVTVIAFLFRHDHGVFIGVAMMTLLAVLTDVSWRSRARFAAIYAALVIALVSPYLLFLQINGGIVRYFGQAAAWAERDRNREPVVWPGLFDESRDAVAKTAGVSRAVAVVRENNIAWTYYTELLLPFFALYVLAISRDAARPSWPHARAKLAMVAVLAVVLDAGFLRSSLEARLADPSVPLAILIAWLGVAVPRVLASDRGILPSLHGWRWPIGATTLAGGLALVFVLGAGVARDLYDRLDAAGMTDRFGKVFQSAAGVSSQIRMDWDLDTWMRRESRPDLMNLVFYVNACTAPTDRVLIQSYLPQVLGLARRAFAGGHADLRPDFFNTPEAQQLTIARLERQSVPIILLESNSGLEAFRRSFPQVTAYIDQHYEQAGTHTFDGRFGISLFTRRDRSPRGTWEPLGWPCFGTGHVTTPSNGSSRRLDTIELITTM